MSSASSAVINLPLCPLCPLWLRSGDLSGAFQESSRDVGGILALRVCGVVHLPHVCRGDAARQTFERFPHLRIPVQRGGSRHRHRVVRRK